MLKKLLEEEDAAGYTLVCARNPLSAHHENPGSALLLPLDMLPSILQQDSALSVRFRLSQNMFFDKDGNNLSKFGRFTVKRIAVDIPQNNK